MRDLAYIPNRAARSLVVNKLGVLALVIPDISNPFFPLLARGAEAAARAAGYTVILGNTDEKFDEEDAFLRAACALRVEAGRVAEARVGVGSVVDRPTLLPAELSGQAITPEVARELRDQVANAVEPFATVHASAAYQRHLTGVLAERALVRAWRNALEGAG